MVNMMQWFTWP